MSLKVGDYVVIKDLPRREYVGGLYVSSHMADFSADKKRRRIINVVSFFNNDRIRKPGYKIYGTGGAIWSEEMLSCDYSKYKSYWDFHYRKLSENDLLAELELLDLLPQFSKTDEKIEVIKLKLKKIEESKKRKLKREEKKNAQCDIS